MGDITIPAHFDGKHIFLDEPFDLEPDAKLLITVISATEKEREDWPSLSHRRLEDAYGRDEPEYTLDALKTLNTESKNAYRLVYPGMF